MEELLKPGQVALSRMGRDKGRYCVIVSIVDENFVLVADGGLRKLNNPKRKRIKHIDIKPVNLNGIAAKLETGQKVFDSELRSALQAAGFEN